MCLLIVIEIKRKNKQEGIRYESIWLLNPNWHELWKQEKLSALAPPKGIFS